MLKIFQVKSVVKEEKIIKSLPKQREED